jgi:hypothetical protein
MKLKQLVLLFGCSTGALLLRAEQGQEAAIVACGNQLTGYMLIGKPKTPGIDKSQVVRVAVAKSEPPAIEAPLPVEAKDWKAPQEEAAAEVAKSVLLAPPAENKVVEWQEPPMPEGALYPDANGIIFAGRAGNKNFSASVRNPWDIRVLQKTSLTEFKMVFGGMIVGDGKAVAFVNGEAYARGDRIGMFNLAEIRFAEVVLESNGTYYVLPEGRKVTVRVANTTGSR